MKNQDNITVVRRLFDLYNKNSINQLHELGSLLSSEVQFHDPAVPHAKRGIEAIKHAEMGYITAFPDKKTKIDLIFATDDKVVVSWTATGKQKGPFNGFEPSHKDFKISGISIFRMMDGKIVEIWQNWDRFALLEQLGELQKVA